LKQGIELLHGVLALGIREDGVRLHLAALHRNYVNYVLIGGLARVIRGADEVTGGVDVCPRCVIRTWSGSRTRSANSKRGAPTGGACSSTRSRCGPSRCCGCGRRWAG
jgi:hypothetical protein